MPLNTLEREIGHFNAVRPKVGQLGALKLPKAPNLNPLSGVIGAMEKVAYFGGGVVIGAGVMWVWKVITE